LKQRGSRLQLQWGKVKDGLAVQSEACGHAVSRRLENPESVNSAAPQIDRRRFRKVAGGTGDFADARAKIDTLSEKLIVEDEIVRICIER